MNTNIIRANIELADLSEIDVILNIDANLNSTKTKEYISLNRLEYYTCINTWLLCIRDWSSYGWISVKNDILHYGLISTVSRFNDVAQQIVKKEPITDTLALSLMHDVMNNVGNTTVPHSSKHLIGDDPIATTLFLLRFPKRLSPLSSDKIRKESIEKFLSVENRSKLLQRQEYPEFIIAELRDVLSQALPWKRICSKIRRLDVSDLCFTTGVGFDSSSSLGSKLHAISKTHPEYFPLPFGTCQPVSRLNSGPEYYGPGLLSGDGHKIFEKRSVKVSAVPKSYKAARIIATENTYRQSMAKRIFKILDSHLPASIDLHDQTRNQKMAYAGSIHGIYSTIDLSNASDCITKSLVSAIFPSEFLTLVEPFIPTHHIIDGKERLMQQFATAGNSLTFIMESLVFWAITSCAIAKYCSYYAPGQTTTKREIGRVAKSFGVDFQDPSCSVYGDDIVIWDPATPFLELYLQRLGFIINEDKSFSGRDNLYRESCGKEYYRGIDLTSLYFPRSPIQGMIGKSKVRLDNSAIRDGFTGEEYDSTTQLIDLQHKLYAVSYPASLLLTEIIKEAHKGMTTSIQGSLFGDLWGYSDTSLVRPVKYVVYEQFGRYRVYSTYHRELISTFEKKHIRKHPTYVREGRYLPAVTFQLNKNLNTYDHLLYDLYKYQAFLKHGPRYNSSLDKLLNISAPFPPIEDVFGTPKMVWKIRYGI